MTIASRSSAVQVVTVKRRHRQRQDTRPRLPSESRHVADLLLIERLVLQQCSRQRIQLLALLTEKSCRFRV